MSTRQGLFVAVDGPKHAGKTSLLDLVVPQLTGHGLSVLRTKEPTERFDLSNEQTHTGIELARLLAADRAEHLARTIHPGLHSHDVVLTDRYIGSSLVFQVLDGVPLDAVWDLNSSFPLPDLNFIVTADPPSLRRRLAHRGSATRFDLTQHVDSETAQYRIVATFLRARQVHVVEVSNGDDVDADATATAMSAAIRTHAEQPR